MSASVSKEIQEALAALREGRVEQAEEICRGILQRQPDEPDALHLSGVIAARRGEPARAVELIHRAIAQRADVPEYHANLADALRALERYDESIDESRKAIALRPNYPIAFNNLSAALRLRGDFEPAHDAAQTALRQNPQYLRARVNLAAALHALRRFDEAIEEWRKVVSVQPDQMRPHYDLGCSLFDNGDTTGAIAEFETALRLQPEFFDAHFSLGIALQRKFQLEPAVKAYRSALGIRPFHPDATRNLANTLFYQGKLDESLKLLRELMENDPEPGTLSNLLLMLHHDPKQRPLELFEEHLKFERLFVAPLNLKIPSHANDRNPSRRLKIGYVSADFVQHAVANFVEPVIRAHDRTQVEVFCYSNRAENDEVSERFRASCDHWRNIADLSDDDAVTIIRKDSIDILVDLSGHTKGARLMLFARKPAPVQATWLGYPGTTGLSAIDYRITDALADPPGKTEHFHTEQLIRLPHGGWCYQPPKTSPSTLVPCVDKGFITFGCLNRLSKINDEVIATWSRILLATPQGKLLLKAFGLTCEQTREQVRERFASYNIDNEQLILLPAEPDYVNHLRVYDSIDIALDCFPYNGTTTSCEALAMGVPVISLVGETHVSRVGLSLLTHAGAPELSADSPQRYVEIATQLASDPQKLADLRGRIRAEFRSSPLCDAHRFTRDLEAAFREMWRKYC